MQNITTNQENKGRKGKAEHAVAFCQKKRKAKKKTKIKKKRKKIKGNPDWFLKWIKSTDTQ